MNEEVERQNIGKKKTEYTTRKHDEWENLFGRMSGFERGNSHFRVEMDARTMEELLRARGRGSGMGMDFGGGMGISEDLIRELLRAAQQGGGFAGFETEGRRSSGVNGDIGNMFGMDRHYETLGVSKNATSEEIKRAYRREVMKWHPDRYKGADKNFADARFRAATEAYDALKR